MNSFGQRLKALRKEAGVSQSFVADHIGVSTQSVSNWECDNSSLHLTCIRPCRRVIIVYTSQNILKRKGVMKNTVCRISEAHGQVGC